MKKIIFTYLVITYAITWTISLGSYYLYKRAFLDFDQLNLIYNFGALGPFLGGLISAGIFYKTEGIRKFFSVLKVSGLSSKSLLLSFSPLLFFAIGFIVYPLVFGHWFTFSETQRQFKLDSSISYVNWILPFITYSIFEEFGWRGFLLPHLQQKSSALKATLILTVFWATWHLPFFLWRFQFSPLITVGFFFAIFIGSILLTSAFNLSRGSILSTILFHFSNNVASALDKEFIVAFVSTAFVFLAIYVVRRFGAENLSDSVRIGNFYKNSSILIGEEKV